MNILMLGRWLPPARRPVRGTREYHFARHLARSHHLTLAFITDNQDVAGAISALRADFGDLEFSVVPRAWRSLSGALSLATGESCTLSYFRSEALRTRLADRLRQTRYDLVIVSSSTMIQYALDIESGIPLLADFGVIDSEWWANQAATGAPGVSRFFRTEAARLRIAEGNAARRATRCVAATPDAAQIVGTLAPAAPVVMIRDGVDMDTTDTRLRLGRVPTVVLNASARDDGNLPETFAFCQAVLPALRSRVPGVRVVVTTRGSVARGPAGVDVEISSPGGDRRLFHSHTVVGAVVREAPDMQPCVLEPMAAGVPVVTTAAACRSLDARPGRDLRVADSPDDFISRVAELLEDRPLREEMGAQGRRFVQENFSWELSASRLGQVVDDILNGAASPVGPTRSIEAALEG
jgi:polysaccharide biosynthesis protein PslH